MTEPVGLRKLAQAGNPSHMQDTQQISVSSGTVDITPLKPARLGGYSGRDMPFRDISDPLEANILLIEGHQNRVLIVTLDALYPGAALRTRLVENLGFSSDEVFLAASHCHHAPMMQSGVEPLGVPDQEYVTHVAAQIVQLVRSLQTGSPARCSYHEGVAGHAMNRRLKRWRLTRKGVTHACGLAPNPAGDKDERIHVVKFKDVAGRTTALVWNYACHPTDHPGSLTVSADFPGTVRSKLRKSFGDIPNLYLQGFSGDVRPPFVGRRPGLKGLLQRIFFGPQFRAPEPGEWQAWADSLATAAVSAAQSAGTPVCLGEPRLNRFTVAEELLGSGGAGDKPLTWHRLDCGGFRIIGVNAEPVSAYRKLIVPAYSDAPLLTVGCIDQTHGYLPVDSMLADGGYEVEGFRCLFCYQTRFQPGMQAAAIAPLLR